jgi:O-antigen/teichoic acid export membrane protein
MLMVFVVVLAALLAEPIIRLLYGKAFLPSVLPFVWLMPAIFALSVNTIFMNYFASIEMPSVAVYSPMIAAFFNIILNAKMIPLYGIIGAAISSIFSYALMLCASLIYVSFVQKNRILL